MCKYIFIILFFVACADSVPYSILSKKDMEAIMWDQMKLDAYLREYIATDSTKIFKVEEEKLQQKIFAFHKIDRATFLKSYNYYVANDKAYQEIINNILQQKNKDNQYYFQKYNYSNTELERNIFLKPLLVKPPVYDIKNPFTISNTTIVEN
jgi:hypothetical protein